MKWITTFFFLLFLLSCTNDKSSTDSSDLVAPERTSDELRSLLFSEIYTVDNLINQKFIIQSNRDTILVAQHGTKVRIYANSFVDSDDNIAKGSIEINLKEAFDPSEIVMSNLVTVSNEGPLCSNGMFHISANSAGKELKLAEGNEIGFMVPVEEIDREMKIYSGDFEDERIVWKDPKPIMNEIIEEIDQSWRSVFYSTIGDREDVRQEEVQEWVNQRERKTGDSKTFGDVKVEILDVDENKSLLKKRADGFFMQEVITEKGTNGFVEDFNTNYIFSVKKLGWANIDKLYSDPATEPIDFLVNVKDEEELKYVYTTLIMQKQNMYLPGYQKEDNSFSFSHGDDEIMSLPIGADAIVLATSYKGDEPYFALFKGKIQKEMKVILKLQPISLEDLKEKLENEL